MSHKNRITWLNKPEEHDYPSALSYLSLIYDKRKVAFYVNKLKRAPMIQFKARDIFRASRLSLLGISNTHLRKDLKKIRAGQELSPLLLVRDSEHGNVVIADGYHRLCAVYSFDEDAIIPCKIV